MDSLINGHFLWFLLVKNSHKLMDIGFLMDTTPPFLMDLPIDNWVSLF